jgi:hypothetical protein
VADSIAVRVQHRRHPGLQGAHALDPIFRAIEHSGLSQWLRESSVAVPALLVLHTIGMGFAAGPGAIIAARMLGFARQLPLAPLTKLLPLVWAAFVVNAISGAFLLTAYPTKALTNPVFFLKLGFIAGAVALIGPVGRRLAQPTPGARTLAALSLALWMAAITAGRLLAYTHTRLLVDLKAHF